MPIGLYQKVHHEKLKRGDIVAVCLPDNIAKEGKRQGYLISGDCTFGTIPVLKRIIALPHDTVKLTTLAIEVNGVSYYAPRANEDHNHHVIKQFVARGIYSDVNDYWLYGFNSPLRSWDSRYYGGVPRSAIQAIYRPILTF